jgi:membrane-associated phospholipid phosphatase
MKETNEEAQCMRIIQSTVNSLLAICGILILLLVGKVEAQSTTSTPAPSSKQISATQSPSTTSSLEKQFLKNILRDQKAIWTSPFHLQGKDAQWLVPVGIGSVALIATDHETAENIGDNVTRLSVSRWVSRGGVGYTTGGLAGGFYLVGRLTNNAKARETGILGAEAIINGIIVGGALKAITQRPRPLKDQAHGRFFKGGTSFPSGHSVGAWSMATIIANEYHNHKLVQIGAYSLASLVSLSRFTGRNHFLSDVAIGSVIGYGIGRYVYRRHHDAAIDLSSDKTRRLDIAPHFRPGYRGRSSEYGLALAYKF